MTDQQQETPPIEATGSFRDGIVTVESRMGEAKITLEWNVEEQGNHIDFLVAAIPDVTERVLDSLSDAQEADDA